MVQFLRLAKAYSVEKNIIMHKDLIPLNEYLQSISKGNVFYIAFSGGLDSRFLAFASKLLAFSPILIHAQGVHIPEIETNEAKTWAKDNGFELITIELDPLSIEAVKNGAKDRCYHCKHRIFSSFLEFCKDYALCDGTNHSDLGTYRPGLKALAELGIHSPLAKTNLTKDDLRRIGKEIGFDNYEQAARPCMLTRFAYGLSPSHDKLIKLAKAESIINNFLNQKYIQIPNFRLRFTDIDKLELHIENDLSNREKSFLIEELKALELPQFEVISVKSVSGFFDIK